MGRDNESTNEWTSLYGTLREFLNYRQRSVISPRSRGDEQLLSREAVALKPRVKYLPFLGYHVKGSLNMMPVFPRETIVWLVFLLRLQCHKKKLVSMKGIEA